MQFKKNNNKCNYLKSKNPYNKTIRLKHIILKKSYNYIKHNDNKKN